MMLEVVEMQAQRPLQGGPPVEFREYLLDGGHWRAGRRFREGTAAVFTGLALHAGREPRAFSQAFESFLEAGVTEEKMKRDWALTQVRWSRVDRAIKAVYQDRPDEVDALEFYAVPSGRRAATVISKAVDENVDSATLRRRANRAVALVWDELGGVW